jgi:hypothetical protein
MDPLIYERLWDKTFDEYDPDALRTRRSNHPIVEQWLADDARGSDPAVNQLHFLYKPYFRRPVRRRRLRVFNTLLWTLKSEGYVLEREDKHVIVRHGWHRTKFTIIEATQRPQRATSSNWTILTRQLVRQIEAKLPAGIENTWEDEPGHPLESRVPDILASFAVWALERKHSSPK